MATSTINGIGGVLNATANVAITTANINTQVKGASFTLPKGVYVVSATFAFNSSGSGARNIHSEIKVGNSTIAMQRITVGYGNYADLNLTGVAVLNDSAEVAVYGASDKTSVATSTGITAVKIA